MPVLILDELEGSPVRCQRAATAPPSGRTTASNSTTARPPTDVDLHASPSAPTRPQRRGDKSRHRAFAGQRVASAAAARRLTPSAISMRSAGRWMPPSPGRANNDNAWIRRPRAWHFSLQRLRHRRRHLADAETFRDGFGEFRRHVHQARHHALADRRRLNLDSSKRKALMMCCCSTGVWLLKNSVACV